MKPGILLLGASGFVGRTLATHLAAEDVELHLVARGARSAPPIAATYYPSTLADAAMLSTALPRCDTIFHLASETTPGLSAGHPAMEINILRDTLRLLEILQDYPDRHLIYLSSGGSVYGNPTRTPVDESTPMAPLSYHAVGKASAELFLQAFALNWPGRVTVLRPSNLYGPGQAYRPGFGIIRTMLEHVRLGTPLEIWGNGETVRDYLYIDDAIAACHGIIHSSLPSATYNVGSMIGFSLNQLANLVEKVTGRGLQRNYRDGRQADVSAIVLDTGKLEHDLNWSPIIGIEEGVARTWKWLNQ